jgi:hypothetical protein
MLQFILEAYMRIDLYTKLLLTLIALALVTIASNSLIHPNGTVAASGDPIVLCSSCYFPGLPENGHLVLMDRSSGDVWAYSGAAMSGTAAPVKYGRLTLGKAVARSK